MADVNKSVGDEIIEGLREFAEKLEKGEPIEATLVERVETPDGPMHLRKKVILRPNDGMET